MKKLAVVILIGLICLEVAACSKKQSGTIVVPGDSQLFDDIADNDEGAYVAAEDDVDLSNIEVGVYSEENKVYYTINQKQDEYLIKLRIVYEFKDGKINKAYTTLFCPNEKAAEVCLEALNGEDGYDMATAKKDDTIVTCDMNNSYISDFADIDQNTLEQVLKTTTGR